MRLLFPGKSARLVRIDCEINLESVFRKKFLNVFRPLHDAEAAAVKVVIETDLDGLGESVDTVEVEVVHRLAVCSHVLIHDSECR